MKLMIHDPKFFLITMNPATIPAINLDLTTEDEFQLLYIDVVHKVKMNTNKQPCETNEAYSFTSCVKNHVSKKFGCRYSWQYNLCIV